MSINDLITHALLFMVLHNTTPPEKKMERFSSGAIAAALGLRIIYLLFTGGA